ncbi:hypothetical protein AX17_002716 [Amanita inopinata Kibby_2008]|nr:hypothetical protein AX17_002716 [Amanita inopinata Kibby_2008]
MPQVLSQPSHLDLPKYIPDYSSAHFLSRPRLASLPLFTNLPSAVSSDHSNSPSDTVDDDRPSSPNSPPGSSGSYHYVNQGADSLVSQVPVIEMYENNPQNPSFPPSSQSYQPPSQDSFNPSATSPTRPSDAVGNYLSSTPSPVDAHPPSSFPHPLSAPHSQDRFPHSGAPPFMGGDRYNVPSDPITDRYSRMDKYSTGNSSLIDQRRMSEPAVLGSPNIYSMSSSDPNAASRYSQYDFAFMPPSLRSTSNYVPSLQRVTSFESREIRGEHYGYSQNQAQPTGWKPTAAGHRSLDSHNRSSGLDPSLSPLRHNFAGGLLSSPVHEASYGPSPPNTGNSTTSNPGFNIGLNPPSSSHSHTAQNNPEPEHSSADNANRTYSFVALPGNAVKKRPRRRYDEIERLYQCSWPDCTKAYGTLNHLNAHVTMQKHGAKRSPSEFKELRKQWRKAKKEAESAHLAGGPLRRSTVAGRFDDPDMYDTGRFGPVHRQHPSHISLGMPSGPVSQTVTNERYALSVDDLRYPVEQRDEHLSGYFGDVSSRPRYGDGTPASWHAGVTIPPRSGNQYPYVSSVSNQQHGQMTQISVHHDQSRTQPPLPSSPRHAAASRLPPDSTLLTPLPGYQPHTMLPPMQSGGESGYDVYEDGSTGRPGTGHASIGPGSGDEFDRRG